ncbi:unnamed protein product [Rotaria sp. Silwood1]|nr:unnamed protein product [Rotaria sp. Silwood1]CAF1663124.1 unnamed protein product [Rotaria sp. Silwood1]CAF3595827.1 unnamed protein product [Rotaria sp. Silwood1]CAF3775094.1 unnamed protein product [Rotaria sp. Silwood1]CAF3839570.1 unnamed protein product [Rotaria sp. Silwood1]
MASNDEYEMALIENEIDAHLCAKLIAEEFALHNCLVAFNQSTPEKSFDEWFWPLMINVLDEKLSFLIRHPPTNEIVAVIIACDLFLECKNHPYDVSTPAYHSPLTDLFDEMLDHFVHHDFDQQLKPNMILFISVVVTKFKHSSKSLATQLSTHICDYARNTKGFQYAFVQTSNSATRHIYVKEMNGKEMTIIDPATWLWKKKDDGFSRPCKDYEGEPIVNILIKLNQRK